MRCSSDLARIETLLYESAIAWTNWDLEFLDKAKAQLQNQIVLTDDQQKKLKELEIKDCNY